ncbi:hypothetical protein H0H92_011816 [Tricholoma furcatifolium]|nr:hypothetical protein H0H92_011816 [Tricholoma furcatifolium]
MATDKSSAESEWYDYDAAARFLAQSCPDSIKNQLGPDLSSPESFACLLYRDHSDYLVKVAENALARHSEVLDQGLAREREVEPFRSDPEDVSIILGSISQTLIKLVNGTIPTPLWTLNADSISVMPHLAPLDLEFLSETEPPVMLYHELGGFRRNSILNGRVQKLFHPGQNTFVFSGSQWIMS